MPGPITHGGLATIESNLRPAAGSNASPVANDAAASGSQVEDVAEAPPHRNQGQAHGAVGNAGDHVRAGSTVEQFRFSAAAANPAERSTYRKHAACSVLTAARRSASALAQLPHDNCRIWPKRGLPDVYLVYAQSGASRNSEIVTNY